MSVAAYKSVIKQNENPRQIERRVFANVTGQMERYLDDFEEAESALECHEILVKGLKSAVESNSRLWMALRFDLSSSNNGLPPDLRARLISLSFWVERKTMDILKGEGSLSELLEVNKSILAGLSVSLVPAHNSGSSKTGMPVVAGPKSSGDR